MHIAYVTEACPPEVDGVTMAVARAVRPLRATGHRVQWVRPRQRGEAAPGSAVEGRSTGAGPTTTTTTTTITTTITITITTTTTPTTAATATTTATLLRLA